jgi:hypothetical protein
MDCQSLPRHDEEAALGAIAYGTIPGHATFNSTRGHESIGELALLANILLLFCGIVISACATQSPLTPIGEGPLGQ